MSTFEVLLSLASPISVGDALYAPTLDSVLCSLIAKEGQLNGHDEQRMLSELGKCIATLQSHEQAVPLASALWPLVEVTTFAHTHVRAAATEHLRRLCSQHIKRQRDLQSNMGPMVTKLKTRRLFYSSRWAWWAEGDADRVAWWLRTLVCVGGKREAGFGAVRQITVRELNRAPVRVNQPDAPMLSRPVPLASLDRWLDGSGYSRDELDDTFHVIVPLPVWPAPAWGGGPVVPTMAPLLLIDLGDNN
jgi:hypothetical protein